MLKVVLGAMGGVFVGALLLEIVRRKHPGAVRILERRALRAVRRIGIPRECQAQVRPMSPAQPDPRAQEA
jgi:hypothetical protein